MSQHQEHTHHVTPIKYYVMAYFALTILMILTVTVVYVPLPSSLGNNLVNLGIAVVKAVIVVLVFMGVRWSTHLTKMFAIAGFVWLSLMGIIFGDYFTRGWEPVQGWYAEDQRGVKAPESRGEAAPESLSRNALAASMSNKVEVQNRGATPLDVHQERP